MNAQELVNEFRTFFEAHPDLGRMHSDLNVERLLIAKCNTVDAIPGMLEQLARLREERRSVFQDALFCAWFGLTMSRRLPGDASLQKVVFQAALMQDIGLLNISEEVLENRNRNAANRTVYERHPAVADLSLRQIKQISPKVRDGVREHHETLDGTGYPGGLVGDQISPVGRILGVCNELCGFRLHNFSGKPATLANCLPLCRLNYSQNYSRECTLALDLIRDSGAQAKRLLNDDKVPVYIEQMLAVAEVMGNWLGLIRTCTPLLGKTQLSRMTLRTRLLATRLILNTESSGALAEPMLRWAEFVHDQRATEGYAEMEELGAMLDELRTQYNRFRLYLQGHVGEQEAGNEEVEKLREIVEEMSELNNRLPDSEAPPDAGKDDGDEILLEIDLD